jgi:hypothetical protein
VCVCVCVWGGGGCVQTCVKKIFILRASALRSCHVHELLEESRAEGQCAVCTFESRKDYRTSP